MTIASGNSGDLVSGSMRVPGHARNSVAKLVAIALATALGLFAVSLILPDKLSQLALDLMSWCLVGALAAGVLFASVKLLEGFLDL